MVKSAFRVRSIAFLVLLWIVGAYPAGGQPVPGRPAQVISAGYYVVDFAHRGDSDPAVRYDYSNPALGVTYASPFLTLGLIYGPSAGPDTAQVRLLDATLATSGSLRLFRGDDRARVRLFVPLGLFSKYQRVRRDLRGGRSDQFDVTVLALTGGVGAGGRVSKRSDFEVRAMPGVGLATRSFGDATGLAYLVNAEARLTVAPIAGRFGLAFGYGFRFQGWNMRLSRVLRQTLPGDIYDYRNQQHGFKVGLVF